MSCVDLARAMTVLANHGAIPGSNERVLDVSSTKRANAPMLTSGAYDASGDLPSASICRVRAVWAAASLR